MLEQGNAALLKEKKRIREERHRVGNPESPEYESLIVQENIIQQFDVIHTRRKLVIDYLVNGDYNVMVMFDSNECFKCKFLRLIYVGAAMGGEA